MAILVCIGVVCLIVTVLYYESTDTLRQLEKSRKKGQANELNRLLKCLSCDKYFRTYQLQSINALHESRVSCPHCMHSPTDRFGNTDVDTSGEMSALGEFLKHHPECPILEGKNIVKEFQKTLEDIKTAKYNSMSQEEINRVTESYYETGNQYTANLLDSTKSKR